MAIKLIQSSVVANFEVTASNKFHAGDGLVLDTTNQGLTVKLPAASNGLVTAPLFAGFALGDHYSTGNTFAQADPVGSTVVSADGSTFTSYANGFFVGAKRAIGDFQDETNAVVTNLTDTTPTSRRGIGTVRAPGSQFISDRYVTDASMTAGDSLYVVCATGETTNLGLLTRTSTNNGTALARCDQIDSTAGLLYVTIIA